LIAALYGKHFRIAELLHRHGADVNVRGDENRTSLLVACVDGILAIVQWLLNHGADVNAQSNTPCTPINSAVGWGHLQVARMLIEFNADIDVWTSFGRGPLHLAAGGHDTSDRVGIMQLLLDHGANPNARDNDGRTPLHHSSRWNEGGHGTVEGTCLLLEYGAIIDSEDNEGRTPLQLALEHDRQDMATCLREHGATR
jgi:ankyrin repeat protein